MTTVYNDYYKAYQDKTLDIANVNFNLKLVTEHYTPDVAHKPADVDKYVINGLSVLVAKDIVTDTMSEIIDKAKENMLIAFESFPYEIGLEIDRLFVADKEKADKLKQLIQMPTTDNRNIWNDLKENGITWFVFEEATLGILCFCEPIEM
jgi:hypothetical protein